MESDDVIVEEVLEERGMRRPDTKHDDAVWVRGIEKQVTHVKEERRSRLKTGGGDLVETKPFDGPVKYLIAIAVALYFISAVIAPNLPCCAVGGECLRVPRHIMWQTTYATMMGCGSSEEFDSVVGSFKINGFSPSSTAIDMWDHNKACLEDPTLVSHCVHPHDEATWIFYICASLLFESASTIILSISSAYLLIRSTIVLPLFTPFLFFGVGCCGALFILSPLLTYFQLYQYTASPDRECGDRR
eukprot:TRINITY_DN6877_c1_g2_i4.p1 TRINITY_DN6877_c1_g2~~TRINITY_DN6877_c1_g2_i4.p1  ORF type:complete len:245 (+),score=16.61 TRINITY_DN6877_c1_g2_i4:38-772(+)